MKDLYDANREMDSCGIGAAVSIDGIAGTRILDQALGIVEHLGHRAGRDADGKTGDGVGVLMQIDHDYFRRAADLCYPGRYGAGMFFLPAEEAASAACRKDFEAAAAALGIPDLCWRIAPVHPEILGERARSTCPDIRQCFLARPAADQEDLDFERRLYRLRRRFEKQHPEAFVCSLSCRTIVYKGMFLVDQLRRFYEDLAAGSYCTALAMVHARFSTNTLPSWKRAHPYRMLLHNGEINTIIGNTAKMKARQESSPSLAFADTPEIYPVVDEDGSDSAVLDNSAEYLALEGMPLAKAVRILIPEPWENSRTLSEPMKEFYEYEANLMEPWDGPAAVVFSDGDVLGAILDRNGLRPARYVLSSDNCLYLASEAGAWNIPEEKITRSGRLAPGRILLVDTKRKRIIPEEEFRQTTAQEHPYGQWLQENCLELRDLKGSNEETPLQGDHLLLQQKLGGFHYEDVHFYLTRLLHEKKEPVVSMGRDIPLAALDDRIHPLWDYFQQRFAQVTNPPIDAIREENVTSTTVYLGRDGSLLAPAPLACRKLKIRHPILDERDLCRIRALKEPNLKCAELSLLQQPGVPLAASLETLCRKAEQAEDDGCSLMILSDRGMDGDHPAVDALLGLAAVNQHLLRRNKRMKTDLIVETAQVLRLHGFAVLMGYGAGAICPYLADDSIRVLCAGGEVDLEPEAACALYHDVILKGIVRIASKMGISTLASYISSGAGVFEALGLNEDLVNAYFPRTASYVGGIGLKEIEEGRNARTAQILYDRQNQLDAQLDSEGMLRRRENGERHLFDPEVIHLLQNSVRTQNYEQFQRYEDAVNRRQECTHLRGCLNIRTAAEPVPLTEVESEDDIIRSFETAAMSYGALSKEAHETLARAMNRMHARSNCGEGGEEDARAEGEARSAIRQVASGRFGVTLQYLADADEIQIKMAQGAKPGEGGQLPGAKVYPWIASCRHSVPGVTLISPPPHHDIYSIEDLAQLIYDLKSANPHACISVKLASEDGVGTIACGVVKAGADKVLISGYDGGTGAAPENAVFHAGMPWELGLAQAHEALCAQGLRSRVVLGVDGKLLSSRDVLIASMLGAQVFAFGTLPLVSLGCLMMRVCSRNTCPAGIATQDERLRCRFSGRPEDIMTLFHFVARGIRTYLAAAGLRSLTQLTGRRDLLEQKRNSRLDLSGLLKPAPMEILLDARPQDLYPHRETQLLEHGLPAPGIVYQGMLTNADRAFGTLFGQALIQEYPDCADGKYKFECAGYAGESFGAFLPRGAVLHLTGQANDYVGKGLSGGVIAVSAPARLQAQADRNIILGNVALYGATGGALFVNGAAGERFGVRNSGALGIVEGVGEHGAEYMTGGTLLILGAIGQNFAAGMSGGRVYLYDPDRQAAANVNCRTVTVTDCTPAEEKLLRGLLNQHLQATGSRKAEQLLKQFDWRDYRRVQAPEYEHMMSLIQRHQAAGETLEEARMAAFLEKYEVKSNG